jgi:hypothetical protein
VHVCVKIVYLREKERERVYNVCMSIHICRCMYVNFALSFRVCEVVYDGYACKDARMYVAVSPHVHFGDL